MLYMFPLTLDGRLNCFSVCLDVGVAVFPLELLLGGNFASPVSNSATVLHFSLKEKFGFLGVRVV